MIAMPSMTRIERPTVVSRQIGLMEKPTLRSIGHENFVTAPKESNRKKMIKKEVSSVLPVSAQGAAKGSNPIPYSLGRRLGSLPY